MKRILSIALCITLALFLLASCNHAEQPLTVAEQLDLGEKYMLELDYEQALLQFLAVIEIEPMNERAYIGAAEAYIGQGDTESAIAILEKGLEVLPDNTRIRNYLFSLTHTVHTWADATCQTSKTCTECGETEGNPIQTAHMWQEANFQEPQTCMNCGETQGNALPSWFESSEYTINAVLDEPFTLEHTAWLYEEYWHPDNSVDIVPRDEKEKPVTFGEAVFTNFRAYDAEDKEDYEYLAVTLKIAIDDDAPYSFQQSNTLRDFYKSDVIPESRLRPDTRILKTYDAEDAVNYYGINYDFGFSYEILRYETFQDKEYPAEIDFVFLVPAGYDGILIFSERAWEDDWADGPWTIQRATDTKVLRLRG